MRKNKNSCCDTPDIKNEGYVIIDNRKVWEYHCYTCDKTWTEKE